MVGVILVYLHINVSILKNKQYGLNHYNRKNKI